MTFDGLNRRRGDAAFHRVHAQIDERRARRHRLRRSSRQRELRVAAVAHVVKRFERRRCGAQHDGHARLLCAHHGEIARRIAKAAFVLLERRIVLFVHDDHAEIAHWREHCRARAEHDARVTAECCTPGFEPFVIRERRMQHGEGHVESLA